MVLDAVVSLVSLFGPKVIDLAKGLFHKKNTPEQTMAVLAQTNPAELANYVNAQAALITAKTEATKTGFSADLVGEVPKWLTAWRGSIRPGFITIATIHITVVLFIEGIDAVKNIPEWLRFIYESSYASWYGDRWKIGGE